MLPKGREMFNFACFNLACIASVSEGFHRRKRLRCGLFDVLTELKRGQEQKRMPNFFLGQNIEKNPTETLATQASGNLTPKGGGGVLYLMGTCGIFVSNGVSNLSFFVLIRVSIYQFLSLNWVKCPKQGIKNRNSVLKWVGKLAIFVLNRVRV